MLPSMSIAMHELRVHGLQQKMTERSNTNKYQTVEQMFQQEQPKTSTSIGVSRKSTKSVSDTESNDGDQMDSPVPQNKYLNVLDQGPLNFLNSKNASLNKPKDSRLSGHVHIKKASKKGALLFIDE